MNLILALAIFSNIAYANLTELLTKEVPTHCKLDKETKYLDKKIEGKRLIIRHKKTCGESVSYLYLQNHLVRTMNQVFMLEVKEDKVADVKIMRFLEPPEYKTPKKWLDRLKNKNSEDFKKRNGIDAISGSTITVNSTVRNIESVLKIHHHISL